MKLMMNKKRIAKIMAFVLCPTAIVGTSAIIYNSYLNNQLEKIDFSTDSIENIQKFYAKDNETPIIFIMNDSQGINLNIGFWKNSYPQYLENELDATMIDGSSLRYNKTSHIDMFFEHNVSVAELKKLNNAGAYVAIQKLVRDSYSY